MIQEGSAKRLIEADLKNEMLIGYPYIHWKQKFGVEREKLMQNSEQCIFGAFLELYM